MSDFDKEAERQRLREKYEEDREDREATQRMSELLLQGATMTNRHCDTCGDPIFRYEGQEFCPTCQSAAVEAAEAEATAETDDGAAAGADERPERVADVERGTVDDERGTVDDERGTADTATGDTAASDDRGTAPSLANEATGRTPPNTAASGAQAGEVGRAGEGSTAHAVPGDTGNLGEARASLVRTLTRLARAAESTDDPRRAREYLSAAREAAEAVAALDRS